MGDFDGVAFRGVSRPFTASFLGAPAGYHRPLRGQIRYVAMPRGCRTEPHV